MKDKIEEKPILRHLTNFWTLLLYGLIIADVFYTGALTDLLAPVTAIYLALLAAYTGDKEFERWSKLHRGDKSGEIFIFVWSMLMLGLFIADIYFGPAYKIPEEVSSSYIAVLGIFAITRRSKIAYIETKKARSKKK